MLNLSSMKSKSGYRYRAALAVIPYRERKDL
jgi:hypothetical protein